MLLLCFAVLLKYHSDIEIPGKIVVTLAKISADIFNCLEGVRVSSQSITLKCLWLRAPVENFLNK